MKWKDIVSRVAGFGGHAAGADAGAGAAAIPEGAPPDGAYLLSFEEWFAPRAERLSRNLGSGTMTQWDLIFFAEPPVAYHLEWMPVKGSRIAITFAVPAEFGKCGLQAVAAAAERGLFGGAAMKPTAVNLIEEKVTGTYTVDPGEALRGLAARGVRG